MTETDALPLPEPAGADDGPRFIRSLRLTNLLSFGPAGEEIELRSLNVLVGANGSGKTNFIEALGLMAATLNDLTAPIRLGGGVHLYINSYAGRTNLTVRASVINPDSSDTLTHTLVIGEEKQRLRIVEESITVFLPKKEAGRSQMAYSNKRGDVRVYGMANAGVIKDFPSDERQSILAQVKSPDSDSEISRLQSVYKSFRLYRSWSFGPDSPLRKAQAADLPNDYLAEDYGNLFLILNRMEFESEAKGEFLERLRDFLPDVTDYKLQIVGGTILMFLMEGRNAVPATRLSDGTLRWLCLLAILVAPSPPGVIVLEEPELGLHPDMINTLADMLKKAATRHQLIITTHSDILIDALSDVPEAVMVVEKGEEGTTIRRLNETELKPWLEEYRLGRLWMQGQIGGTRW